MRNPIVTVVACVDGKPMAPHVVYQTHRLIPPTTRWWEGVGGLGDAVVCRSNWMEGVGGVCTGGVVG